MSRKNTAVSDLGLSAASDTGSQRLRAATEVQYVYLTPARMEIRPV